MGYQWISHTDHTQPGYPDDIPTENTADTVFTEASTDDALAIYITDLNDPPLLKADELLDEVDPTVGPWFLCTESLDGVSPAPPCDAAAVASTAIGDTSATPARRSITCSPSSRSAIVMTESPAAPQLVAPSSAYSSPGAEAP